MPDRRRGRGRTTEIPGATGPRPTGAPAAAGAPPAAPHRRPGDWQCPTVGCVNHGWLRHRYKQVCPLCEAPRPADGAGPMGSAWYRAAWYRPASGSRHAGEVPQGAALDTNSSMPAAPSGGQFLAMSASGRNGETGEEAKSLTADADADHDDDGSKLLVDEVAETAEVKGWLRRELVVLQMELGKCGDDVTRQQEARINKVKRIIEECEGDLRLLKRDLAERMSGSSSKRFKRLRGQLIFRVSA